MKPRIALLLVGLPLGLCALGPTISNTNAQTLTVLSGPVPTAVGLIQGRDGNFYVTTSEYSSSPCHCGAVFRITPSGSLTNLYSFRGGNDGSVPTAPLVQGSDGYFYGTTTRGGTNAEGGGYGTVFRITPNGTMTNLYSFHGGDGAFPDAGLAEGNDGAVRGRVLHIRRQSGWWYRVQDHLCRYVNHGVLVLQTTRLSRWTASTGRACPGQRWLFLRDHL